MSKTLHKQMVGFALKTLAEADDFIGRALPKVEAVGAELDLKFARNRIRSVRDLILEHAVEDIEVETASNVQALR
jgi:hypothetical protein